MDLVTDSVPNLKNKKKSKKQGGGIPIETRERLKTSAAGKADFPMPHNQQSTISPDSDSIVSAGKLPAEDPSKSDSDDDSTSSNRDKARRSDADFYKA